MSTCKTGNSLDSIFVYVCVVVEGMYTYMRLGIWETNLNVYAFVVVEGMFSYKTGFVGN